MAVWRMSWRKSVLIQSKEPVVKATRAVQASDMAMNRISDRRSREKGAT